MAYLPDRGSHPVNTIQAKYQRGEEATLSQARHAKGVWQTRMGLPRESAQSLWIQPDMEKLDLAMYIHCPFITSSKRGQPKGSQLSRSAPRWSLFPYLFILAAEVLGRSIHGEGAARRTARAVITSVSKKYVSSTTSNWLFGVSRTGSGLKQEVAVYDFEFEYSLS